MKKMLLGVLFFLSINGHSSVIAERKQCLLAQFASGQTPIPHQLKINQDWYCSGVLLFKDQQGKPEQRLEDGVLLYRFFKKDWGMANYFWPESNFMPLTMGNGQTLRGLYSPIAGVGDSFLTTVLRVNSKGQLLAEWSVGQASAKNPEYTGAHINNPESVTTEEWNGYIDRRLVTRLYICSTNQSEILDCIN